MDIPAPDLPDLDRLALLVVDVQRGFDDADLLITKHVNSCFHGKPGLHQWLHDQELQGIVIAGITTNHCCETTARVGANLGHHVVFVLDAAHTFDRPAPDGTMVGADQLAAVTAANLHGEFAAVANTQHLLDAAGHSTRA